MTSTHYIRDALYQVFTATIHFPDAKMEEHCRVLCRFGLAEQVSQGHALGYRITPHVLRHTCASWQVQAGVPLYSVQRWLGHSTIKMTERYAHLAPEHLQEGAAALAGAVDKSVNKSA